jgi:hypothetical protein
MMFLIGVLRMRTGLLAGLTTALAVAWAGPLHAAKASDQRGGEILSPDAIICLTLAQDAANFLTQVSPTVADLLATDVTDHDKGTYMRQLLTLAKKANTALAKIAKVTRPQDAEHTLAIKIQIAQTALASAVTIWDTQVHTDPLSTATIKAAQKVSQAAQKLADTIGEGFAKLPKNKRPPTTMLTLAADQSRVFYSGETVRWSFTGPAGAFTQAELESRWSQSFQDWTLPTPTPYGVTGLEEQFTIEFPSRLPLSNQYQTDSYNSATLTRAKLHTTANDQGGWIFLHPELGTRRPSLLLLNLGPAPIIPSGDTDAGGYHGGTIIIFDYTSSVGFVYTSASVNNPLY